MDASKRADASNALYKATAPLQEGKLPETAIELEKVVKRFGGTPSGSQAAMMLGQVYFDQQKYAEGIAALEKSKGAAGSTFEASIEALIAVGYEAQGKFEVAAEHYGRAAAAAKFPLDKGANQANQARNLTLAGKTLESRKIWEELTKNEDLPYAQEAQVRLGELLGAGK
jgi:predicted negative regulator of RcsB-dependent stress response